MADLYRRAMDLLYILCSLIAGISMVLISAIIPYSVYTRYVLNQAASWPEPMAILLTIVLTFFGAAACYRDGLHMRVRFFVGLMPMAVQRLCTVLSELLVAAVALFMVQYGWGLCVATWDSSIDAFPALSVGVTYLPIPIGGAISLLFVIERMTIGGPPPAPDPHIGDPHAGDPHAGQVLVE
jgi:TRAP-type C4-dicarboxylate transport system permease small subunit